MILQQSFPVGFLDDAAAVQLGEYHAGVAGVIGDGCSGVVGAARRFSFNAVVADWWQPAVVITCKMVPFIQYWFLILLKGKISLPVFAGKGRNDEHLPQELC